MLLFFKANNSQKHNNATVVSVSRTTKKFLIFVKSSFQKKYNYHPKIPALLDAFHFDFILSGTNIKPFQWESVLL